MAEKKIKNEKNVYKEFWELANQAQDLVDTGNYDVDMLISAWKHQLTAANFFYGKLVKKAFLDLHQKLLTMKNKCVRVKAT